MKIQYLMAIAMITASLWGILAGILITNYYIDKKGEVVGLYFGERNIGSVKEAIEKNPRYRGEWIAIDIEWMEYYEAVEVCRHEVAHHIFERRDCKENPKECLGIDETEEYAEFCESNLGICIENEGISMP